MQTRMKLIETIVEIGFLAIHSIILIYAWDRDHVRFGSETREMMGWLIIGCCLLVLGIEIMFLIKE